MASPALSSTTGVQPVPRPLGPVIVVMIHTRSAGTEPASPDASFPVPRRVVVRLQLPLVKALTCDTGVRNVDTG